MPLERQNQRYNIMTVIVALSIIVIYAIHIFQYQDAWDPVNIAEATIESLMIIGIMLYNYKMVSSYIVGITAGLIGGIYGIMDWEMVLFFSLFGLMITIIRILSGTKTGEIKLPDKPLDRVDYLLNLRSIHPVNIDHLYRAMYIVIMLTVMNSIKNNYMPGNSFGSDNIFTVFIICIPLFLGILYGMNSIDALVFGFIAYGAETLVCLQYYQVELEMSLMFQATVRIIMMFMCAYSYWFGMNQFEED